MNESQELRLKELNQQGRTLFSCDKYEESLSKYNEAMELDPLYLDSYFNACESYIMLDRFSEARELMNKVIIVDKNNGQAYFHLGNIALLEENDEDGKLYYAKAINNGYDNIQIYMNLAALSEENDELERAIEYYNKVVARNKLYYPAKIRKIEIYMAVNKPSEALNACDDLIETNPEIFEGHHYKFAILISDNKFEEAEKVLDKAQGLFPDDQGFVLDRVKLLEIKGNTDEALSLIEKIDMDVVPKGVISIEKANVYLRVGKIEEAKSLLLQVESEIANAEIERTLLAIYTDTKEYEMVVNTAKKIIDLQEYDTIYFSALYYYAYGLKMLGKTQEATKAFEEAAKIMLQACSINSGLLDLYIYRAICYVELKDYERALEMVEYVETVDENIAEVHYIKHYIYKDSNPEKSEAELNIAKNLNPDVAALFAE